MWYVLHLFVDLDKFLSRFQAMAKPTRALVKEMVTLKQPSKALYQSDLAMFTGYVFVQVDPKSIKTLHLSLRSEGIGEVLSPPGYPILMPLRPDEVQWIYGLLQSRPPQGLERGARVRILRGAFEGMEGVVESVAGQTVSVRVQLRRSESVALCTPDQVVAA